MEKISGRDIQSDEKILTLQRCVSKMDKLFHKSEKEYLRQVEKLKHELEKKDRLTQVIIHYKEYFTCIKSIFFRFSSDHKKQS